MTQLVFLLEEPSMKALLDGFLPTIVPPEVEVVTIAHEGKSDLEASIPRKLRAWRRPDARFFILRDQDSGDCRSVKRKLTRLVGGTGRSWVKIRIVCRELESWVLADADGLAEAFQRPELRDISANRKFRTPDSLHAPAVELMRIVPGYQKVGGARVVGPRLNAQRSRSSSFRSFVAAVQAALVPGG